MSIQMSIKYFYFKENNVIKISEKLLHFWSKCLCSLSHSEHIFQNWYLNNDYVKLIETLWTTHKIVNNLFKTEKSDLRFKILFNAIYFKFGIKYCLTLKTHT